MSIHRTPSPATSRILAPLAFLALLTAGSVAWACESDADCPAGLTCIDIGGSDCAEPACPPGEPCPPSACGEPEVIMECIRVPAPCTTNADCLADEICETFTGGSCSGGGWGGVPPCPPGEDCPMPEPMPAEEECETFEESYCVPRWAAGCDTADDCGPGFTCEDMEICTCSGGGGSSPDPGRPDFEGEDGGDGDGEEFPLPVPDDADCTCEPSGERYCELIEASCTSDADCAIDGWTCMEMWGDTPVCISEDPAECPEPDEAPASAGQCAPPGYGAPGAGGPGWAEDTSAPRPGEPDSGTDGGTGGGSPSDDDTVSPPGETPAPPTTQDGAGVTGGSTDSGSGCQAAPGSGTSGAGLAGLLLGLLAFRRRRLA